MPFDGTVALRPATLADLCASAGLNPIPLADLARYKAEQLRKHRASWLYRPSMVARGELVGRIYMTIVFILGASSIVAGVLVHPAFVFAALLVVPITLGFIITSRMHIKGPARWIERHTALPAALPEPIAEAAQKLAGHVDYYFTVGELYQEKVMLDPYLLAHKGGATVCLGIWDGNKIIACA